MTHALLFPGQGAQFVGMGKNLWDTYPELVDIASRVLGYSIVDLCLYDRQDQLRLTQYTQPAVYVVNALHFYHWREKGHQAHAFLGHSLGEYTALLAAGCFDFETGLRLVQKRGLLMAEEGNGRMLAVLGVRADELQALLRDNGLDQIDLANFNSPTQLVVAGDALAIEHLQTLLTVRHVHCVALNVSAAFHSRQMRLVQQKFALFLEGYHFKPPSIPVIANVTASPYPPDQVANLLARHVTHPVLWDASIRYLMKQGEFTYEEMGADPSRIGGTVLSKLVVDILSSEPLPCTLDGGTVPISLNASVSNPAGRTVTGHSLGSAVFRERYGVQYAYVVEGIDQAVTSVAMVVAMSRAGMMSYFGSGGLSVAEIEAAIGKIQSQVLRTDPYGFSLTTTPSCPDRERATVELYLKCGVRFIEAVKFRQITAPLVLFRIKGLHREANGQIRCLHHVLARVSRLDRAEAFMSPAPSYLVKSLLEEGAISAEEAQMAGKVPMSHEICVESEPGEPNDGVTPHLLLPCVLGRRHAMSERYGSKTAICVGLAGGIGDPVGAAAAFTVGADFIVTGSINQCTVESGASSRVKELLQRADIHDMVYVPSFEQFEAGGHVQVLTKGLLFPSRAKRLCVLFNKYTSMEDIPEGERKSLEENIFKRSIRDIEEEVFKHLGVRDQEHEIARALNCPRVRMAHVFKWYFWYCSHLARGDSVDGEIDFAIKTSPAIGVFNQWVKGTESESWQKRHVDEVAVKLMESAAEYLYVRLRKLLDLTQ